MHFKRGLNTFKLCVNNVIAHPKNTVIGSIVNTDFRHCICKCIKCFPLVVCWKFTFLTVH